MSTPLPERADVRQLRIQAKELFRSLQSGDPEAIALDPSLDPASAKLADAQRLLARKHGFASWPKLVEQVETPELLSQMRSAIEDGDSDSLDRLLKRKPALRKRINEPMFGFDSQPIVRASHHRNAAGLLPVLVRHGADPNIRTRWWAGGFSSLNSANDATAELLISLGAQWDVWSAAGHGQTEVLRRLLDEEPERVNAPGGDGERPLHFAKTPEIAELLIERGADIGLRDVDHESTPAQYQIRDHEVLRTLLKHGAKPDVFMAAELNDVPMLKRILAEEPDAPLARVGTAPFVTRDSEGGHIYDYKLGTGKTPQQVAAERGNREVLAELEKHGPLVRSLVAAAWVEDEKAVARILKAHPEVRGEITPKDSRAVAAAAQEGRAEVVRLLLEAGFDPTAPGMDSGTALHVACWFGHLPVVRMLLDRVPLELPDAHHGSPPLGWACHGAQWCRNERGDYPGVVEALLAAGADPAAPANTGGTPMLDQAGNREDVKAVLRKALGLWGVKESSP